MKRKLFGPVIRLTLGCIVGLLAPAASAQLISNTWLNFSGGNWSDAANWSNSVIPNTAAFFTEGSNYSVTQNVDVTLGTIRLWVAGGTYVVPAGRWLFVTNVGGVGGNNNNGLSFNHPSTMTLLINGGLVTNSGFYLGGAAQLIITNNGLLYTRNMGQTRIDRNASLTQYSGVWDHLPSLEVAFDGTVPGPVAYVNLFGGTTLIRGSLALGARETGILTINGGTLTNWVDLTVGASAPSFYASATGLLNLASGTIIHIRNLLIGDFLWTNAQRSQFTITGGEYRNITNAAAQIRVGNRGTGALHVAGGSFVATNG
ncbi:MAG: hypothetical protein N2652_00210, partial [Kiritimatiellae bacterium]|nr:hypothetical protein [Kiritimatiellia bacterium]